MTTGTLDVAAMQALVTRIMEVGTAHGIALADLQRKPNSTAKAVRLEALRLVTAFAFAETAKEAACVELVATLEENDAVELAAILAPTGIQICKVRVIRTVNTKLRSYDEDNYSERTIEARYAYTCAEPPLDALQAKEQDSRLEVVRCYASG